MAQNTKYKKQAAVQNTKHAAAKKTANQHITWAPGMPFGRLNYLFLIAGMVVLAIGYFLLSGGGTDNPNEFSEKIFDTRRLTVAPIVLVIGFAIEFVAIFIKIAPKTEPSVEP